MSKSVGVKKKSIWRDKASWELLILCVPTLLAFTLFHYVPMIGIILPFRRFMPAKGLFGSPWVGFENFRFLFTSVELARIMRNTVLYSLWFMFITPAVNVTIALLLFEVTSKRALKYYQPVISFQNFMFMVIVGYIARQRQQLGGAFICAGRVRRRSAQFAVAHAGQAIGAVIGVEDVAIGVVLRRRNADAGNQSVGIVGKLRDAAHGMIFRCQFLTQSILRLRYSGKRAGILRAALERPPVCGQVAVI